MRLTPNQKSALHMIAHGHRPRLVTVRALKDRGLVAGSVHYPKITAEGSEYVGVSDGRG